MPASPTSASRQDIVLLLTATIDPKEMHYLHRSDPQLRLADYRESLKSWLANPATPKLIFCENSGYDLSELSALCAKNNPFHKEVEFISTNDNHYPRKYGKGYGEIRIMEEAIEKSRLIGPNTLVVKVTGRLYSAGIGTILRRIGKFPHSEVYCNMTGYLNRAETYLFVATVPFLKNYLFPLKEVVNDSEGIYFEHTLARAVHTALAEGKRWSVLPGFIDLRGVSGTTGIRYTRNFISRLKGRLFYRLKVFVIHRED